MKKALLLAFGLTGMIMTYAQSPGQKITEDFKKLDWLAGDWARLNLKPGRTAWESWKKISATEWTGSGINMKGSDTAFIEKLKLVIKNDNIYYVAELAEKKEPVYFQMTTISNEGFVCENPQHDFPKKIAYQKEGNQIKATISGDGKSIAYLFEKK